MTASVAGQSERWPTACGEIPPLRPLGTVLGGVRENPDVIPVKVPLTVGDLNLHPIGHT